MRTSLLYLTDMERTCTGIIAHKLDIRKINKSVLSTSVNRLPNSALSIPMTIRGFIEAACYNREEFP